MRRAHNCTNTLLMFHLFLPVTVMNVFGAATSKTRPGPGLLRPSATLEAGQRASRFAPPGVPYSAGRAVASLTGYMPVSERQGQVWLMTGFPALRVWETHALPFPAPCAEGGASGAHGRGEVSRQVAHRYGTQVAHVRKKALSSVLRGFCAKTCSVHLCARDCWIQQNEF